MMHIRSCLRYFWFSFVFALSACDSSHSDQHAKATESTQLPTQRHVESSSYSLTDEGMPLAQAAGRVALPEDVNKKYIHQLTQDERLYVGRYHVKIPCSDPFAGCNSNEKETEYIINLSDNGMVYWTNTSFGRLSSDANQYAGSKIEQACKDVHWYAYHQQNELVIRCDAADVSFYYDVDEHHNLVFNLDKIWNADHGRSRKFFKEYPFPQKAYVFEKIQ